MLHEFWIVVAQVAQAPFKLVMDIPGRCHWYCYRAPVYRDDLPLVFASRDGRRIPGPGDQLGLNVTQKRCIHWGLELGFTSTELFISQARLLWILVSCL